MAVLAVVLAAGSARAAPEVVVYGASWCGPCQSLKRALSAAGVSFTWRDVDEDSDRQRFLRESGGDSAIPLTVVDGERVRGANFPAIAAILTRKGTKVATPPTSSGELFGGESGAWWQEQFRDLRQRVAAAKEKAESLDRVAVDDYERGVVLKRLQDDYRIVRAALEQLERDASRVAVPRQFRAY